MNFSVLAIFLMWILATAFWWGFAFLQLPGPTPDWLLEARAACFGQTVTGLPDADGWRTLIFPPLFMLVSILFVFWRELKSSLLALFKWRVGQVLIFSIILGVAAEAALIAKMVVERTPRVGKTANNEKSLPEGYLRTEIAVDSFQLIDHNQQSFSSEKFQGKKTVLTFAFANCHTVCPMVVKNCISAVDSAESDTQLVIITLDPWRDSPARLKSAADMWQISNNASILSGEVGAVLKVLDGFKVSYERNKRTGDVNHPPLVYLLDKNGRIAYSFNNPTTRWIKNALARL